MNILGHATPKSANRKTGPMAAIYREVGATCPSSCPMLNNGCYARRGPTAIHAKASAAKVFNFDDLISRMSKGIDTVRLNVTGDFLKADGTPDEDYLDALEAAAKKYPNITFYGYTHAWDILAGRIKAMPKNVTILASVNSKEDARKAAVIGLTYARVTSTKDREAGEVYCPVDKAKKVKAKPTITCRECRLCFDGKGRNIVFFKV